QLLDFGQVGVDVPGVARLGQNARKINRPQADAYAVNVSGVHADGQHLARSNQSVLGATGAETGEELRELNHLHEPAGLTNVTRLGVVLLELVELAARGIEIIQVVGNVAQQEAGLVVPDAARMLLQQFAQQR